MSALLNKIKRQNLWLRELCSQEDRALAMCKTVDLATCEPEVVVCAKGDARALHDYWRVVLSSEQQNTGFSGGGRELALMLRDRVTGAFLGVLGMSDMSADVQLRDHLGWRENNDLRLAHQHRIFMMRRCLPVYEFGQMTGGKLLALTATSRDVIRLLELRYSYQFLFFGINTLHGKGSQYNRLQQRGIELISVDERNRGFYGMELRKKAVSYLRDETDTYGKTATHPFADQVSYWRERWLQTRMKSLSVGPVITIDPDRYRLSKMLDAKRMTPENVRTMEGENGTEPQEEAAEV